MIRGYDIVGSYFVDYDSTILLLTWFNYDCLVQNYDYELQNDFLEVIIPTQIVEENIKSLKKLKQ